LGARFVLSLSSPGFLRGDIGIPAGGIERVMSLFLQMNMADSERMAGVLESIGYSCTEDASDADVLIYNTCSIREKAETKVYSALGRQAKRKRQHGNLKIVVAGCVAKQEGEQLLRRVPEVDLVMGGCPGWWTAGGKSLIGLILVKETIVCNIPSSITSSVRSG
jgi:hypothetical protein